MSPCFNQVAQGGHGEGALGNLRIGDAAFLRTGTPAVVKDREPVTGKLKLEEDRVKVHEATRHGYLNGIEPDKRAEFYKILDEVKADTVDDPATRVEKLQTRVSELEADPTQRVLARYLRAEMVHIMNSHGLKPKEYVVDESIVR